MPTIDLNRTELYEAVWSRPLYKVASDYGLSDVGLAKACRRLDVPTPPRGYWGKLEAGKAPKVPPLPPSRGEVAETTPVVVSEEKPSVVRIAEPEITVRKQLRSPHRLVAITKEELAEARPDEYGRIGPRPGRGLDIRVSPAQLSRALRVAEALIRGLEDLGYSVEVGETWTRRQGTWAVIDGQRVQFTLRESSSQRKNPAALPGSYARRYVYVPNGCLELKIDEYATTGATKTVRDRPPRSAIESRLGKFIVGLHACAQVMAARQAEREEEERKRAEARAERERQARRGAYEKALGDDLLAQAVAHREATLIREYLAALEAATDGESPTERHREWVAWAHAHAEEIDPLANGREVARPLEPPDDWQPRAR